MGETARRANRRWSGNFDAADGEIIDEAPDGLVKLSGQHQLLGWHLHRDTLAFLHDIGRRD